MSRCLFTFSAGQKPEKKMQKKKEGKLNIEKDDSNLQIAGGKLKNERIKIKIMMSSQQLREKILKYHTNETIDIECLRFFIDSPNV